VRNCGNQWLMLRRSLVRDDDAGAALGYAALILAIIGDMSCQRGLGLQIDA